MTTYPEDTMDTDSLPDAVPETHLTITRSPEINELALALSIAQGQMDFAKKDTANPFYHSTYANLASCWAAARQPLADNKLALLQFPSSANGTARIETLLAHASGQWVSSVLTLPVVRQERGEGFKPADDPQAVGSAISYGRRYAMTAILGIAQDDDDGNAASGKKEPPAKTSAKKTWGNSDTPPVKPPATDTPEAVTKRALAKIDSIAAMPDPIQQQAELTKIAPHLTEAKLGAVGLAQVEEKYNKLTQDIAAEIAASTK